VGTGGEKVSAIALRGFALIVVLGVAWQQAQAQAQDPKASYTRMAPLDQYLMADQNAEIALGNGDPHLM
jgi:hypothetical protein